MRSTQRLLEKPLIFNDECRQKRLDTLKLDPNNTTDEEPDKYLDQITFQVMNNPCNLSRTPDKIYFIDQSTASTLKTNPVSNEAGQAWWDAKRFPINKKLSERIETWVRVQQIKEHCRVLTSSADRSPEVILKALKAINMHPASIPKHFFSMLSKDKIMIVPIRLDNKHIICLTELLASQPTQESIIENQYRQYFKESVSRLQSEYADIELLLANVALPRIKAVLILAKAERDYSEKYTELCQTHTLEWYKNTFFSTDRMVECYNPITHLPLQSIKIEYGLLEEIDNYLEEIEMPLMPAITRELYTVRKIVEARPEARNYADELKALNVPRNTIPIAFVGYNPFDPEKGSMDSEIMTEPVIIDDHLPICYQRLKQYWKEHKVENINPKTGKPIATITYAHDLKKSIDHFILNRAAFSHALTKQELNNPLLRFGSGTFFKHAPSGVKRRGLLAAEHKEEKNNQFVK
jgi:hypothetical protein